MNDNYTYEVCPYCDEEVQLDADLKVQTCPHCGKRLNDYFEGPGTLTSAGEFDGSLLIFK